MAKYRETSRENWNNIKDVVPKWAKPVYELFKEYPERTVNEIRSEYVLRHREIPRNELAKSVSYLSDKGLLVEVGKKKCSLSGKMLLAYKACDGKPERKKKQTEIQIIQALRQRIAFLESTLRKHNIAIEQTELF